MKTITITKSSGKRIDKFLAQKYRGYSRRFFQNEIEKKNITVNGKNIKRNYKLQIGDHISFDKMYVPMYVHGYVHKKEIVPNSKVAFEVIFEHQDFLIIEKPPGLSVHPPDSPGPQRTDKQKEETNTLANGLLAKYPSIKDIGDDPLRPGIVHRLDKDTSGLLIIAKNQKTFEFFKNAFKKRIIKKKYLAIIWGIPKEKTGTIQTPIGKSKANITKQSTSNQKEKLINPKNAITHWQVLKHDKNTSLLEVKIETGRKHQIRVHLHSIGHPVVGDKKYQTKLVKEKNKQYSRHLLHAFELKFKYQDGQKHKFRSEIPKDFVLT